MGNEKLKAGIYAIINKKLKTVYVGETEVCFLIRWIEHISRIPHYIDFRERMLLYLDVHTKYIVLKKLDPAEYSRKEFYKYEYDAINFYKEKDWIVVSRHNYSPHMSDKTFDSSGDTTTRYKKAITHMIKVIEMLRESCDTVRQHDFLEILYATGCRLTEVHGLS